MHTSAANVSAKGVVIQATRPALTMFMAGSRGGWYPRSCSKKADWSKFGRRRQYMRLLLKGMYAAIAVGLYRSNRNRRKQTKKVKRYRMTGCSNRMASPHRRHDFQVQAQTAGGWSAYFGFGDEMLWGTFRAGERLSCGPYSDATVLGKLEWAALTWDVSRPNGVLELLRGHQVAIAAARERTRISKVERRKRYEHRPAHRYEWHVVLVLTAIDRGLEAATAVHSAQPKPSDYTCLTMREQVKCAANTTPRSARLSDGLRLSCCAKKQTLSVGCLHRGIRSPRACQNL